MHVSTLVRVTVPIVVFAGAVPAAAGVEEAKLVARRWVDENAESLKRVNKAIWTHAEVGLKETRSAQELVSLMRANGFRVEMGVAGMPTAFVASWGSGKPVVGILAEYDALPGLSQDAVPEQARAPGRRRGPRLRPQHLRPASAAAAVAAKQALAGGGALKGTIRLYGTPAEETLIGKVYMLREGQFNDLDVMPATWHAGRHDHGGLRLLEGDGLGEVPLQGPARPRLGLAARGPQRARCRGADERRRRTTCASTSGRTRASTT